MLRRHDIIKAIACSAAELLFAPGVLATFTPLSAQAALSILSVPSPARITIFKLGASSSNSGVTVVADLMISPFTFGKRALSSSCETFEVG